MVGGTTGTGILVTPAEIAAAAGSPSLTLWYWLIGGGFTLLAALQLAELGAMLPQAGGWMGYAERAFGRYVGYVVGWSDWVSSCVTGALVALLSAEFLNQLLPAGWPLSPKLGALLVVAGFGAVQWWGLRAASRTQELTSVLMGGVLAAVLVGSWLLLPAAPAAAQPPTSDAPTAAAVVAAFQAVVFAYDGWYAAIYFAEEDYDPARDLPRSLLLGVGLILLTYLALNAELLRVLSFGQLTASPLPLADVAARLAGPAGRVAVLGLALCALGGVLNSVLLMATRVLFALSRDGLLSPRLARVSAAGTPRPALAVAVVVTAVLVLSGTAEQLLAITSILFVAYYATGFAAVLVLRRREPHLPRPFRAWGYPVTTGVVLAGAGAFLGANILADPGSSWWAGLLVLVSYPAYRWVRRGREAA
ncbi:APC family permease [Hymenobacter weizhouensis]|uniref:APC family permease n=1 Tax=Hymenobacter sp. YIM 151500-1 TaxID=2987689 RepID=UPI002227D79F|nr:APC family permease [Hymenobacter sp. YIM 151500-1]UYZ65078.1 APC family permease [Hymenobacter sp. YIM 151500-1]